MDEPYKLVLASKEDKKKELSERYPLASTPGDAASAAIPGMSDLSIGAELDLPQILDRLAHRLQNADYQSELELVEIDARLMGEDGQLLWELGLGKKRSRGCSGSLRRPAWLLSWP